MAGRNVVIKHNRVVEVQSGTVKVRRINSAQRGISFRLTIKGQKLVTNSSIEELVTVLENRELASGIIGVFNMKEAPTIATVRPFLPRFNISFPWRHRYR